MQSIFDITFHFLQYLAETTGLSYNEINIIVYYFFIPMIYLAMIDKILKTHLCKLILFVVALLVLVFVDFNEFSDWLFQESVVFLNSFQPLGWNYMLASVIICVFTPLLIFIVLFYCSYWQILKNHFAKPKT